MWVYDSNPRAWVGKNHCKGIPGSNYITIYSYLYSNLVEAEDNGVSLIHGNASSFYVLFEEIFRQIYKFWHRFIVNKDKLEMAGPRLREVIRRVRKMYEDQEGREDKSPCSKVKNIANIMVKKLEDRIKQINI